MSKILSPLPFQDLGVFYLKYECPIRRDRETWTGYNTIYIIMSSFQIAKPSQELNFIHKLGTTCFRKVCMSYEST